MVPFASVRMAFHAADGGVMVAPLRTVIVASSRSPALTPAGLASVSVDPDDDCPKVADLKTIAVVGVTALEAADCGPVSTLLMAATLNV